MFAINSINNTDHINISNEYLDINSLFSHAIYQIVISNKFHIHAPNHVYIKNLVKFILKTQAGRLINCLTTVMNLAKKVVILQWFWKYFSVDW